MAQVPDHKTSPSALNVMIVGSSGRLTYEAVLFAASLRRFDPEFEGRLFVAEPQPGPRWHKDPRISDGEARRMLVELGAEIVPFESRHFGSEYPNGNKAEGLFALPKGRPFLFFDTDTIVTGPLSRVVIDPDRPSASMQREGSWPRIELYGPGYTEIWRSLYERMGLDFETSLDRSQPEEHWERYLYFNAGWFFGPCPHDFAEGMLRAMLMIRDDPPESLTCQPIFPWLDQIALPLAVHALGGGRPGPELDGLDGDITCHWRILPLAYARESDAVIGALEASAAPNRIKRILKKYEPMKRMIYQGRGRKVRAMFDRGALPAREQALRNEIRRAGYWMR